MTFWPDGFDPRDPSIAGLHLCEIDTPDGPARFMVGVDGVFTETSGNEWYGSQLIGVGSLQAALDGVAPEGSVSLSYFQDPDAASLIADIKDLGLSYIDGRPIRFYIQPINDLSEFYAPVYPPVPWLTRTMRGINIEASGAQDRRISVSFESPWEARRARRARYYNTAGHAALIGEANPSLEFAPTSDFTEEKLWG